MTLHLKNSLSGTKEPFIPLDSKLVKMYVCGPTVYDLIHLGNARSLVVYDVLYRLLCHIYGSQHVLYVRNITDVDDKINTRALELGISIFDLTKHTITQFHKDAQYLNCLLPNIEPRATEHITQMIEMIISLIEKNHAYHAHGNVYFDVASFTNYGKIAGRVLNELVAGARVEVDEAKRNPADFLLWKKAPLNAEPSAIFSSPWGDGMPGWHIECSSMAGHYLGKNFDIHGGGVDLIFPHHTNEIAQSCCAEPGSHFAKYWVHNGFLKVDGEKMSKSLGNFITVADLHEAGINTSVVRYVLLNTSYHKPLDYKKAVLHEAQQNIEYLRRAIGDAKIKPHEGILDDFFSYLKDDLNTHGALNNLLMLAKEANKSRSIILQESIKYGCFFLGLLQEQEDATLNIDHVKQLIDERAKAKLEKNWAKADKIREQLTSMGVSLQDSNDGSTIWRKANIFDQ